MEELQVGEFIRTESGELYKIDYVGESVVTAGEEVIIPLNYIKNHSFKPIDLVKKGDYVNGIYIESNKGEYLETLEHDYENSDLGHIEYLKIYPYEIKSIVTSEKFASVEFNVEE